ncbi:MAG TPA: hypothetical protein DCZ80_03355 [Legionellales bacterium]|nr:hypothetical protein [Legionellales bacterium]
MSSVSNQQIKMINYPLVRVSLFSFLITFISLRALVFCIMKFRAYYMYVFIDGRHIHHFTEGFIMLALLAGYMIFFQSKKTWLIALLYGMALGLTFDEFGMWICLNINYWQQSSFLAVAFITIFLAILAYAPSLKKLHLIQVMLLIVLIIGISVILRETGNYIHSTDDERLRTLFREQSPDRKSVNFNWSIKHAFSQS